MLQQHAVVLGIGLPNAHRLLHSACIDFLAPEDPRIAASSGDGWGHRIDLGPVASAVVTPAFVLVRSMRLEPAFAVPGVAELSFAMALVGQNRDGIQRA